MSKNTLQIHQNLIRISKYAISDIWMTSDIWHTCWARCWVHLFVYHGTFCVLSVCRRSIFDVVFFWIPTRQSNSHFWSIFRNLTWKNNDQKCEFWLLCGYKVKNWAPTDRQNTERTVVHRTQISCILITYFWTQTHKLGRKTQWTSFLLGFKN